MNRLGLIGLIALIGWTASAQLELPTDTNAPPAALTNSLLGQNIVGSVLNVLPAWDPNATNAFGAHEFEIRVAPLWKSITASGNTPYLSTAAEYYFTKALGAGLEMTTFGNGDGSSDSVDGMSVYLIPRLVRGNIALYGLLGGGRDFRLNQFAGQVGVGIEYRYSSAFGIFADTRASITSVSNSDENGWLTRIGGTIHF